MHILKEKTKGTFHISYRSGTSCSPRTSPLIPSKVLCLLPLGAGRAQVPTPRGPGAAHPSAPGVLPWGVPPPLQPEKSRAGVSQPPRTNLYSFLTRGNGGPGPQNTEPRLSLRGGGKHHSFLQKSHPARKTGWIPESDCMASTV